MAVLLAITISLAAIPTQSASAVGVDVSIDVNQTIDQILDLFKFEGDRYVVVINKTDDMLERVGSYNDSSNWPAGDVNAMTANKTFIEGTQPGNTHSFAANYKVTDTNDTYFQYASSWPLVGERKINLCGENLPGNKPAKHCWQKKEDANDVIITNNGYNGRATIQTIPTSDGNAIAWVYEVSNTKE